MDSRMLKSCAVFAAACLSLLPMGCKKQPPITLACNTAPTAVFAGEQVTATATAGSISTKKNNSVLYNWSGTGATGNGPTTTIATAALDPGSFTVKADVKEGKKGKEGLKPGQSATCSASFTVKEFEPPTISCSANPSTIKPGETSTITATGMSPQNRPLTYSFSAANGSVTGSGSTATYTSTGAPVGPNEIACKVADDKNHTAISGTTVSIVAPPPPPVPHVQMVCGLDFDMDKRRPTRVNNESKACLDELAIDLQKQPDAKAVLVGDAIQKEKDKTAKEEKYAAKHKRAKVEDFAAQRAVNVKEYLVKDKGIDPSRITVATGTTDDQKVNDYVVPAGANVAADIQGTEAVSESTVKPEERKPLSHRHHRHKAAQ